MPKQYDIRDASFERIVELLFGHDVAPATADGRKQSDPWYWDAQIDCDVRQILDFYIQLFEKPEYLLARYTREQLEQGFWAIISGNIACSVSDVIWDKRASFEQRADCVRAMYHLYERLFSQEPLNTAPNMWWDVLAYDWHCGNRMRENGGEDKTMQDVIFETLEQILTLSSEDCQAAALHGLGHLHHPNTDKVIEGYLTRNPTSQLRAYAEAAGRFEIM